MKAIRLIITAIIIIVIIAITNYVHNLNNSINQGLFSIQTNNNNIYTFVYMNTERAGNEVKLLIQVSSQIKWQE